MSRKKVMLGLIMGGPVVLLLWFVDPPRFMRTHGRVQVLRMECEQIIAAFRRLESQTGKCPIGANSAVFQSLLGSNDLHIVLLYPKQTNGAGEMLDVWGNPLQLEATDSKNLRIRSAGENGRFKDGDDFVFDESRRDFVNPPK